LPQGVVYGLHPRKGHVPNVGRAERNGHPRGGRYVSSWASTLNVRCSNCGQVNSVPDRPGNASYHCHNCGALLPKSPLPPRGETSEAVGLIGGAALGAAVAGPIGAIVGAIIGAVIGREAKGVG
jgi:hypothetical protein